MKSEPRCLASGERAILGRVVSAIKGLPVWLSVITASMAATASAHPDAAPVVRVPPPSITRSDEEKIALAVTNLITLVARPDPRYETFAALAPDARLLLIGRRKIRIVEGTAVREALTTLYQQPNSKDGVVPGSPVVQVEHRFGRFSVPVHSVGRGTMGKLCQTIYGDAVPDGSSWFIVNLTITPWLIC